MRGLAEIIQANKDAAKREAKAEKERAAKAAAKVKRSTPQEVIRGA